MKLCPKCGKTMEESIGFPGLWCCPDSKILMNDEPPFMFKCDGLEITDEARYQFDREVIRQTAKLN